MPPQTVVQEGCDFTIAFGMGDKRVHSKTKLGQYKLIHHSEDGYKIAAPFILDIDSRKAGDSEEDYLKFPEDIILAGLTSGRPTRGGGVKSAWTGLMSRMSWQKRHECDLDIESVSIRLLRSPTVTAHYSQIDKSGFLVIRNATYRDRPIRLESKRLERTTVLNLDRVTVD